MEVLGCSGLGLYPWVWGTLGGPVKEPFGQYLAK